MQEVEHQSAREETFLGLPTGLAGDQQPREPQWCPQGHVSRAKAPGHPSLSPREEAQSSAGRRSLSEMRGWTHRAEGSRQVLALCSWTLQDGVLYCQAPVWLRARIQHQPSTADLTSSQMVLGPSLQAGARGGAWAGRSHPSPGASKTATIFPHPSSISATSSPSTCQVRGPGESLSNAPAPQPQDCSGGAGAELSAELYELEFHTGLDTACWANEGGSSLPGPWG